MKLQKEFSMSYYVINNELYHHGIKGQKWGVRRFQNPDGTRTEAGKKRYIKNQIKNLYGKDSIRNFNNRKNLEKEMNDEVYSNKTYQSLQKKNESDVKELDKLYNDKNYDEKYGNDPVFTKKVNDLSNKIHKNESEMFNIETNIGKKYVDKFNNALLSDIGIKESDRDTWKKALEKTGNDYIVFNRNIVRRNNKYKVFYADRSSIIDISDKRYNHVRSYHTW